MIREVPRTELPLQVAALLEHDEPVLYYGQPIRRAGGIGVWMILALGVVFTPAALGALAEIRTKVADKPLSEVAWAAPVFLGALLFLVFSLMLLAWPWLSDRDRRRTHVVVTGHRVLRVKLRGEKPPRTRAWRVEDCDAASVARRRGASATLVLKERVRIRRTDDRPVYEWDALHGLPRADDALAALLFARDEKRRQLESALRDG